MESRHAFPQALRHDPAGMHGEDRSALSWLPSGQQLGEPLGHDYLSPLVLCIGCNA